MKYQGRSIKGPKTEILAIPRDDGDIIFTARAVQEIEEFEEILPPPQPPLMVKPGNIQFKNIEDPDFKIALGAWSTQKMNWMILKSLEASEGLEWERVKMDDPETWSEFRVELKESGFNAVEIAYIINAALRVNTIDEAKMEEARARFLVSKSQTSPKQ